MACEASHSNLERLRRARAPLAARLEACDASNVEVALARDGGTSLREGARRWSSAYGPLAEARRWVDSMGDDADLTVLLGLGAGHHLDELLARSAGRVLVYEPSLARLRAAIAGAREVAWVDDERVDVATSQAELADFYQTRYAAGLSTRIFAHPVLEKLDPDDVRSALGRLSKAKNARDTVARTRVWMSAGWLVQTARNARGLVESPDVAQLAGAFAGRPAVVVAAGPSLDKQLSLLAAHRDRVLVIAIGQTLRALRKAGIEPDFVHVLEAQDVAHQLTSAGTTCDLDVVLSPNVHPGLFALPVRRRFVAYPSTNALAGWVRGQIDAWRPTPGGSSVSLSAIHVAAMLGASPVLVIGQDLAFTDGRTYASNSPYESVAVRAEGSDRVMLSNVRAKAAMFGIPSDDDVFEQARWVEGWDGGKVLTTASYATFIEEYASAGRELEALGAKLVNCTEGGARLPGVEHARFADALARVVMEPFSARAIVDRTVRDPGPQDAERLLRAIARARRRLRALARQAARGRRIALDVLPRAAHPRPGDRALLEQVARAEQTVRRGLGELGWLDDLVRPHLHDVELALRRARDRELSLAEALSLSAGLFEALAHGVGPAIVLLGEIADGLRAHAGT